MTKKTTDSTIDALGSIRAALRPGSGPALRRERWRHVLLTPLIGLLTWSLAGYAHGQSDQSAEEAMRREMRSSLQGIEELDVVVETLRPEAEQDGLRAAQITTDVELKLRLAQIRVDDDAEPYLYVNVNTKKTDLGIYAICARVEFRRVVYLRTGGSQGVYATTWRSGRINIGGANTLHGVRGMVTNLVDEFINDYLAANAQ